MAVFASTPDPAGLSRNIERAVKRGAIASWELKSGHLRHADPRYEGRIGFFKLRVTESAVKFCLVLPKKGPPVDGVAYAYLHARLTELLLAHFSEALTRVHATPFTGHFEQGSLPPPVEAGPTSGASMRAKR